MGDSTGVFANRHDSKNGAEGSPAATLIHACAIVVDEDWTIQAASDNCDDVLGRSARDLLGRTLGGVFQDDAAHALRAQVQALSTVDPVGHILGCPLADGGAAMDVTATRTGTDVCFEIEPAGEPGLATESEQLRRLARRIAEAPDMTAAVEEAVRALETLTGFDRVSVHRTGRSGLASALACEVNHPLSGAPGHALLQAVADDFHTGLHLVRDVSSAGEGSELLPAEAPLRSDGRALGNAAPSLAHAQALNRERIRAAMTIPVRTNGELWGAILCHHGSPRSPSVGDRSALMQFAELFGDGIRRVQQRLADNARTHAPQLRDRLASIVAEGADLAAALGEVQDDIAALLPHDGWVLWHQGRFESAGLSVPRDEFEGFYAILHERAERDAFPIDRISDLSYFPRGLEPASTAVMVLPLSSTSHDFLLFFRSLSADPDRGQDRVRSWEGWEVDAANALRGALIEVRLNLTETTREARLRAQERQGVLIAELNHRMRNMLNVIQGFVGQRPADRRSVEEFASVLEARIVALARANDDLTDHDWGRVALNVLLERELGPYVNGAGPVVRIVGDQIDLSPTAFSTMALVLHELTSNARKHGALRTPSGQIDVATTLAENGLAQLVWTETGGPHTRRPEHPGYGLTLIEQSVPYELRGTAKLDFTANGLIAVFSLPPGHFTRIRPHEELDPLTPPQDAGALDDISIDGAALILDDSLIIAIESEELLRTAGASEVYSCNSVDAALDALDKGDVTFALLDVNLGSETSLPVAEQLWIDGIPAVLATGYGANEDMLNEFPPLPVLSKPYTVAEIKDVLRHFRDRHHGD